MKQRCLRDAWQTFESQRKEKQRVDEIKKHQMQVATGSALDVAVAVPRVLCACVCSLVCACVATGSDDIAAAHVARTGGVLAPVDAVAAYSDAVQQVRREVLVARTASGSHCDRCLAWLPARCAWQRRGKDLSARGDGGEWPAPRSWRVRQRIAGQGAAARLCHDKDLGLTFKKTIDYLLLVERARKTARSASPMRRRACTCVTQRASASSYHRNVPYRTCPLIPRALRSVT
jgi:hypothetical protein